MKIYDWNQIKQQGDCLRYMTEVLGMRPKHRGAEWTQFSSPWRPGSDGQSFSVRREGYHDNKSGETGSIIDLVANARFNGDTFAAQEWLGEWLGLTAREDAKQKRKFVCAYDYVDLMGELRHQTVRWDPKAFSQRRPDPAAPEKYIYNLTGIEPILYRWPEWADMPWVCVVGGEKDANNLWDIGIPATTNAMGEGNWRDSYNEALRGKNVCVIHDLDDAGRKHAATVHAALQGIAASVKVLTLEFPEGVSPHKDASDWIKWQTGLGNAPETTRAALLEAIKAAPAVYTPPAAEAPVAPPDIRDPELTEDGKPTAAAQSEAKLANATAFSNFEVQAGVSAGGKDTDFKVPRHVNAMMADVWRRFWVFPRRVGSALFDHDRNSGQIRLLDKPEKLFAWIAEKSGHNVRWSSKIEGAMGKPEFFESLHANARSYELISGVPNWPPRHDVYYTHDNLPSATPDARYFEEFCSMFSPADEVEAELIRLFVAAPVYFKYNVARPIFIVDSNSGQGSGKTALVEMIANLYGGDDRSCCSPMWVSSAEINNESTQERVIRRLMSPNGRKKRFFVLDNETGYIQSNALATFTSRADFSGMAPYGHGEENRPNDLTFCITSNSATFGKDITHRALFVYLKKPERPDPRFASKTVEYIKLHRLQIIADIIGILERGPRFSFTPVGRWKEWESDVMVPICGTMEAYSAVWKRIQERCHASDGEVQDAETIEDHFAQCLAGLGVNPDTECAWIQTPVCTMWAAEAIPGFGGRFGRGAAPALHNMAKVGNFHRIGNRLEKYPHHGHNKRRGFMWNQDLFEDEGYSKGVRIIEKLHDRSEARIQPD